jgi:D-sedoheptulose 7-phosphate isomerase
VNPFRLYIDALEKAHAEDEFQKYQTEFDNHNRIIILGNGGSNSVASHISQDYMKFHQKKVSVFSDPSMLTMLTNDYGYEHAYVEFLKYHCEKDTLVVLISSSGESLNMINCQTYCNQNGIDHGILTGFSPHNTMRRNSNFANYSKWNYHVDSESYGVVECVHQIFLHGVV